MSYARTAGVALGAGALALLGYAAGVEPYAVETVRLTLRLPRLPVAFDGYTILQVSDLHMSQMGRRETIVRSLIDAIGPVDLVAVTGDLVHTQRGIAPFLELAQSFQARDGAYAIFGNSEHKNGVRPHAFAQILADSGIPPLMNSHVLLSRGGVQIALAGVDDPVNDLDRLPDALRGIPDHLCTLLLMHSPDGVAEAVVYGVDLVLSGHTHGGQIRFPLVGAPYTHSYLGRRMSSGLYTGRALRRVVGIRPGRTQLYVSRGIGISGLVLRFLTRPEITVLTLRRGHTALDKTPRKR